MALVDYGVSSSSSSSEDEYPNASLTQLKRPALPTAAALLGPKQARLSPDEEFVDDNPALHGGRIRSFKHERGNWATYVYVPALNCAEQLEEFQSEAIDALEPLIHMQAQEQPLHLSLSRTVVLQHHQIEEFSRSLQQALNSCMGFPASLQHLKVYTNEERTRTFLAVQLEAAYLEKMSLNLQAIDQVMTDYRLARFYDPPSFHVSLLWCVGDQEILLKEKLKELQQLLEEQDTLQLAVQEIRCKCGNKDFSYKLK